MEKLLFKRSGTFTLRNGWVQKAMSEIEENPGKNIFNKDDGVEILGIGSNMVSSLSYWMNATGITEESERRGVPCLSEFGELIREHDPYLEDPFTWFMIHHNLVKNRVGAPLFNFLFCDYAPLATVSKSDFVERALEAFGERSGTDIKREYVESDVAVAIRSYLKTQDPDPEANMDCPLSRLGLLELSGKIGKDESYAKKTPEPSSLDPRLVYYVLRNAVDDESMTIEEAMEMREGPSHIFNLDSNSFMLLMTALDKIGYLRLTKTAGLNTFYFKKEKEGLLEAVFKEHFGGNKQ